MKAIGQVGPLCLHFTYEETEVQKKNEMTYPRSHSSLEDMCILQLKCYKILGCYLFVDGVHFPAGTSFPFRGIQPAEEMVPRTERMSLARSVFPWDLTTQGGNEESIQLHRLDQGNCFTNCTPGFVSKTHQKGYLVSVRFYFKTFSASLELNLSVEEWTTAKVLYITEWIILLQ